MKILHVITSLYTGGAESLVSQIAPMIRDKGHEVEVVSFIGKETPFMNALKEKSIKVHSFAENCSVYDPRIIPWLRRIMKRFDIVHTHNTSPQFFAAIAAKGLKCKLVTTEHNTYNRRRKFKLFAIIDRWMYNAYQTVICISDKTEELLTSFIGRSRVRIITIYNGIDITSIHTVSSTNLKKDKYACRVAIIQVAAFRPQKDQDTTIKALNSLPQDIHLYLVGDGARRPEIESLITAKKLTKRVHLLGVRPDVPALLKASDIVVMSSHWEGFGLAAAEGMAARKPVIASDVDGLREVVSGAGILFPPQNAETLAKEILRLDADRALYERTAAACLERAKEFDIHKMVDGYCKVYDYLK